MSAIRQLDLQSCTVEEILALLEPMFHGYVVSTTQFDPGFAMWRGRIFNTKTPTLKPRHITELYYPSPEKVGWGRVNRRYNPVLYCSSSRKGPLFELRPCIGDYVALVQWVTTAPLLINHVGYTDAAFDALHSDRAHTGLGFEPEPAPGDATNVMIKNFLAETFTKVVQTEHEYKLSVAVAERMFSDDLFNALIYPTIQMNANADNIAVKTRYADTCLQFKRAEYVRIDAIEDEGIWAPVLDTATALAEDGSIKWKGHADRWTIPNDRTTYSQEGGSIVARDASGIILAIFAEEDGAMVVRDAFGQLIEPD